MPANAAGFSWVGSANTSTLRVNELADSLSRGITERCARTYSDQQYLFYFVATDYLDRRDGTYVYSVGVSLFKKAQQWSAAPVSSHWKRCHDAADDVLRRKKEAGEHLPLSCD